MKKLLFLIICVTSALPLFGQSVVGSWNGELAIGQQKLRLIVHIVRQDSLYKGTLDSPDQGAKGIPLSKVTFTAPELSFEINQLAVVYKGVIQGDTLISGIFTQSGASFPLSLTKTEIVINRPQEPKPPYPYKSEDVTFPGTGGTLAGTLTIPHGAGKYPAVILVTGSGPQNRDEELVGHKPFLVISDHLTRNGIAVLRYDDRGVGESTGNFATGTTEDNMGDALAAFDYLTSRPEIDRSKTGILGHSEGGTIVLMAAARQPEIAFIVSLAGVAVRGDSLLVRQNKDILLAQGFPAESVEIYCTALPKCYEVLRTQSHEHIVQNLNQILPAVLSEKDSESLSKDLQQNLITILMTPQHPWMRYFLSLDPAPYMKAVRCPVLALNGKNDLQVNSKINLDAMAKHLSTDLTIREYKDMNHLFQHSATGLVSEYGQLEETISPQVLKDITEWILKIR